MTIRGNEFKVQSIDGPIMYCGLNEAYSKYSAYAIIMADNMVRSKTPLSINIIH